MVLAHLISSYRQIISSDGNITKSELLEMLELDNDIAPENKTKKYLNSLADEILHNKKPIITLKTKQQIFKQRLELYNNGYSDYEIADIQRVSQSTINAWRKRNNLKAHPKKRNPIYEKRMEYRMELYELGYNDSKIASLTGVSSTTIYMWRKSNKLPSQNKRPMKKTVKNV